MSQYQSGNEIDTNIRTLFTQKENNAKKVAREII